MSRTIQRLKIDEDSVSRLRRRKSASGWDYDNATLRLALTSLHSSESLIMNSARQLLFTTCLGVIPCAPNSPVLAQRTAEERQALVDEFDALTIKLSELKQKIKQDKIYDRLEGFLDKKIENLRVEKGLNESQVKRLQLAARGAVERHVAEMRKQELESNDVPVWMEGMEECYCKIGNVVYVGNKPQKHILVFHPIWQHAVAEVESAEEKEEERQRKLFHQ